MQRSSWAARVATATVLAALAPACAHRGSEGAVEPLAAGPQTSTEQQGTAPRDTGPSGGSPIEPPVAAGQSGVSDGGNTATSDARQELRALLGSYDRAITALYADPWAAGDDVHPLSVAWLEVVTPGSQLDREVRGRILSAAREDNLRIIPPPFGTSFTNTALAVTEEPDGSLTWDNCGYAPGVGVDITTGAVLDERRASLRGRGTAVRGSDGHLVISQLFDDETTLLGRGDADPCPDLAAAALRAEQQHARATSPPDIAVDGDGGGPG